MLVLTEGEYGNIVLPAFDMVTVKGEGADKTIVNGYIQFKEAIAKFDEIHEWNVEDLTVNNSAAGSQIAININGNSKVDGLQFNVTNCVVENSQYGIQVASGVKNAVINLNTVKFSNVSCAISVKDRVDEATATGNSFTVENVIFENVRFQLQMFYGNKYYEVIGGEATPGDSVKL